MNIKIRFVWIWFLLLSFFTSVTCQEEGFVAGTLIKTATGFSRIEDLCSNDTIMGYHSAQQSLCEDKIVRINNHECGAWIEIIIDDMRIRAGTMQRFFCLREKKRVWIQAQDLRIGDQLFLHGIQWVPIQYIEKTSQRACFYSLSTAEQHNFFVSNKNILAHNFVLELGTIAGLSVLFEVTASALAFTALWAGSKIVGSNIFCPATIKPPAPPNDNDWWHYWKKPKHGFQGKDPKKIWNFVLEMIMVAIDRDELREGIEYRLRNMTEYGELEVVGTVFEGVAKIGTMYIKDIPK